MKYLLIVFLMLIVGCEASTKERTTDYVLPEGLKDCKVYEMSGSGLGYSLKVLRCPSMTTTCYQVGGKSKHTECVDVVE